MSSNIRGTIQEHPEIHGRSTTIREKPRTTYSLAARGIFYLATRVQLLQLSLQEWEQGLDPDPNRDQERVLLKIRDHQALWEDHLFCWVAYLLGR